MRGFQGIVAEMIERMTAFCWIVLAVGGIVLRLRRLAILYSFRCTDPWDVRYHHSVIRSSWLRLAVKIVFLLGGGLAYWLDPSVPAPPADAFFWCWRVGILLILMVLLTEDLNVERMRRMLGTLPSGRWDRESRA